MSTRQIKYFLQAAIIVIVAAGFSASETFKKPPGRANKKLCCTAFPMMEELRLEPVD